MYESLTGHIGKISQDTAGEVITDHRGDGTPERPYQMPFVSYSNEVEAFVRDIYAFEKAHRELKLNDYQEILGRNGIRWNMRSMTDAPAESLDAECILALLLGAVRAEKFVDGALLSLVHNDSIERWLERLKDLDDR